MGESPTLPAYGRRSLADLLPSVAARLGVPGAEADLLGLPDAQRYVVLLVDALGWHAVRDHAADAPYLHASTLGREPLTCGVPSTTVTSLASLGTGLPPGGHGMAGYLFREPASGRLFNALAWDIDVAGDVLQPVDTWLARSAAAGVQVTTVAPSRFENSGLTTAGLRGAEFWGFADERDEDLRISLIVSAATSGERALVYSYERELDHAGHALGTSSWQWLHQLQRVDAFCERLRATLPDDVVLLVTGDHGMVDVPSDRRVHLEDHADLAAGVSGVGGEGRLRQLYTREPGPVAARWRDRLGDRAWVLERHEARDLGWFGDLDDRLAPRFGDVLVALREDWAVMSRAYVRELDLVGMHGSLTAAEMLVPLVVD